MKIIKKRSGLPKQHLIDIAEELFVKQGYEKTSINDILKRARISKGGFYHHFVSKNEIFGVIIDQHLAKMEAELELILANKSLTALRKMERYIVMVAEMGRSHSNLFFQAFAQDDAPLVSQEYFDRSQRSIIPLLVKIARQGEKEGTFKVRHPEETFNLLLIMRHSSLNFLLGIVDKNWKESWNYFEAINSISEKALGLPEGFFRKVLMKNFKNNKKII